MNEGQRHSKPKTKLRVSSGGGESPCVSRGNKRIEQRGAEKGPERSVRDKRNSLGSRPSGFHPHVSKSYII